MGILSKVAKTYNTAIVKSKKITSQGVKCIHRIDHRNAGDLYCAPYHYYPQLDEKDAVDIYAFKKFSGSKRDNLMDAVINHKLIIGGGGLLNCPTFEAQMRLFAYLANRGKKVVFWGLGHNSGKHHHDAKLSYNINHQSIDFFATRDITKPGEYVPCVSCKHQLLDEKIEPVHELGVFFHKKTLQRPHVTQIFEGIPNCDNTQDIGSIIKFIQSCDQIITNSYHGMYWSMLLGKKVAAIAKNSKYYDFAYQPTFTTFDNALNDIKKAQIHEGLLTECRSINDAYAERVFDYLEIEK